MSARVAWPRVTQIRMRLLRSLLLIGSRSLLFLEKTRYYIRLKGLLHLRDVIGKVYEIGCTALATLDVTFRMALLSVQEEQMIKLKFAASGLSSGRSTFISAS